MSIKARFKVTKGDFCLDVDLDIPSTGVTALFGPSGCGKTTLLRAIAGLEQVPGGMISVRGEFWQGDNKFIPPHKRSVGYVFQEASLFAHMDVRRNLEYGLRRLPVGQNQGSFDEATDLLGIAHLLHRRPHTLSGGEKQRVAIARALAANPDLLLMDEPLASLDAKRKKDILPYLESLHRSLEIPLIYVSHDSEEVARLADHMVLMDEGKVTASGAVQDMFTRLDLPLAHGADAAAVIEATVISHDKEYHLTQLGFGSLRVSVPHCDLLPGSAIRMRVSARDVSLTLEPQSDTSILNILPVKIEALVPENEAQVTVRLLADGVPLLARVTRKSAAKLKLEPGRQVFAQVKSIAILN